MVDRWVRKANLERFQTQLDSETDPRKREVLEQLIRDEKAKLKSGAPVER